jgi:DNA-binding transcriptional ArsR family regulator
MCSTSFEFRETPTTMVEVITPQSRIRDLTAATRHIPIEVDGSGIYELVVALWSVYKSSDDKSALEVGDEWLEQLKTTTAEDLREEIEALGGPGCGLWLGLLGLVVSAPHPHDPDRVLAWLAEINPQRLRRWLLAYVGDHADPALIEEATDGDLDALRKIVSSHSSEDVAQQMVAIFEIPADEVRDRMVTALARFRSEVFSEYEADFSDSIRRAAAAQRAVTSRDHAKSVIEQVTNGLDYEIPLGVTRVVLIPSVVLRPLSLIDQQRDTLLVIYGMADEFIDSDPEAPPSWLIKTYKALSDERRMRILRRLSEGETTLDELTELLGLSKSTVHHHISVLRAAGLVRVRMGQRADHKENHTYTLRGEALVNAGAFLDSYVRTDREIAANQ